MLINNVEIEDIDLLDAEVAEKYEKAMDGLQKESGITTEGSGLADTIRKECNLIFNFFNTMFGEGTDKKIFGNKTNYGVCTEALKEVIEHINEQIKELDKATAKYSINRATRK